MKFATSAVAMLAMALTSNAAALGESNDLSKRGPVASNGYVYMCSGSNWPYDKCENVEVCYGACQKLEPKFYGSLGSFGPDKNSHCTVYSDSYCKYSVYSGTYPGNANLYYYNGKDVGHSSYYVKCTPQKYY